MTTAIAKIGVHPTELVPVSALTTYPGNYRRGNVEEICASLAAHGQYKPVIAQRSTRHVLAGNNTFLAIQRLGWPGVLVQWLDVDDEEAKRINIVDNRLNDLSQNDPVALSVLLDSLRADSSAGLAGTGYDEAAADELRARLRADAERPDGDGAERPSRAPPGPTLADRFLVPPFSVLDARKGEWQTRKRQWLSLGIQPKMGSLSEDERPAPGGAPMPPDLEASARSAANPAGTQAGGLNQRLAPNMDRPGGKRGKAAPKHHSWPDRATLEASLAEKASASKGDHEAFGSAHARRAQKTAERRLTWAAGDRPVDSLDDTSARNAGATASGTSIFDPVLIELGLRWFCPPGGRVLDPFCGGTSQACVTSVLRYPFVGVEVRADQVEINRALAKERGWDLAEFACADSGTIDAETPGGLFDFVQTDPPYFSLERYSDQEADGSTKRDYPSFLAWYENILRRAAAVLKEDRFMVVKIGEARSRDGCYPNLVGDTVRSLMTAGLRYYNELILVTSVGSLPVRAGQVFSASRKVGKTHQQVLVFVKGDPKRAHAACGPVSIPDDLLLALMESGAVE